MPVRRIAATTASLLLAVTAAGCSGGTSSDSGKHPGTPHGNLFAPPGTSATITSEVFVSQRHARLTPIHYATRYGQHSNTR
ncbi:hypothetical protein [Streptomyces sp. NBC_00212]|uniref:hypothetical protein n=1 Tax=Streptomyces sp. NBC_00212 TaxID=2975684 RepID=UPI00324B380A